MNELLQFLLSHWQASGLFIVLLIAYIIFELLQNTNTSQVSPEQAVELFNHQHGVILDIRAAEAFKTGHIIGAVHVDAKEPDAKMKRLQKYMQKPIVVVCGSGKSSVGFVKRLKGFGFAQVFSLAGGMTAWQDAGLPVTKD